jgi:hypothetical protein
MFRLAGRLRRIIVYQETHARSSDGPSFQHHILALQQASRAARAAPQKPREGGGGVNLAAIRLAQINRLLSHRKGSGLAEESQADLVEIVAGLFVGLRGWPGNLRDWIKHRAPGFNPAELAALINDSETTTGGHWNGALVGRIMRLTAVEAVRLKINTISPFDVSKAEIEASRKVRKRDLERKRRRAAGIKPQTESAAQKKPWEALGVSRRTYYRRNAVGTESRQDGKEHLTTRPQSSANALANRAGLSAPARAA